MFRPAIDFYMSKNFGGSDYWAYQVPVVGKFAQMWDNSRYWQDYYKNTGFRPRYPGRQYGSNGVGSMYSQAKMLYGSAKKIYG